LRFFKDTKRGIELENSEDEDPAAALERMRQWVESNRLYHEHLAEIADRLGAAAYNFFHLGWADTGLHDGILLSLSFGDHIGFIDTLPPRLRFGRGMTVLEMKIVNYNLDTLHVFTFKGLKSVVVDIPSDKPLWFEPGGKLGSIYSYEVVSASPEYLTIEWLLDSGGTILVDFKKLLYKKKKLRSKSRSKPQQSSGAWPVPFP
jgi:hypothetical protein